MTPAIFGVLMYGHVFKLTGLPSDVLVGFWVLVIWIAFLAAWRFPLERVLRVDRALLAVGALFVGVSLVSIVPYEVDEAMAAPHRSWSAGGRRRARRPRRNGTCTGSSTTATAPTDRSRTCSTSTTT